MNKLIDMNGIAKWQNHVPVEEGAHELVRLDCNKILRTDNHYTLIAMRMFFGIDARFNFV